MVNPNEKAEFAEYYKNVPLLEKPKQKHLET
jgi:hypothetical protein